MENKIKKKGCAHKVRYTVPNIIDALKQNKGYVKYTAKYLGVSIHWIYKKIEEHNLWQILEEIRHMNRIEYCDKSENVLYKLLNREDVPQVQYKAAVYFLNNLGQDRGFNHPNAKDKDTPSLSEIEEW